MSASACRLIMLCSASEASLDYRCTAVMSAYTPT